MRRKGDPPLYGTFISRQVFLITLYSSNYIKGKIKIQSVSDAEKPKQCEHQIKAVIVKGANN